ncbi:MAG: hypothetical protein R3Y11_01310 [Pseudomonadota bacterium]
MTQHKAKHFEVFSIREYVANKEVKQAWTRVGTAFQNRDGSWNIKLHVLPLTNPKTGLADLHMRAPRDENTTEVETYSGPTHFEYDAADMSDML